MTEGGWYIWLGVAVGSAFGGVVRYAVIDLVTAMADPRFPWGTLVVNISGSLLIGMLGAVASPESRVALSPALRHTLMGGVLGGFTTFSSFSLQTLALVQTGELGAALLNVLLSVTLCIGACAGGWTAALWWVR